MRLGHHATHGSSLRAASSTAPEPTSSPAETPRLSCRLLTPASGSSRDIAFCSARDRRDDVEPPSSRADVMELIARGDVTQSSFAFRTFDDDWDLFDRVYPLRTLISGQLVDVAPVVSPAYPDTTAAVYDGIFDDDC